MSLLTASKIELAKQCAAAFALPHTIEVHAGQEDGDDRHDKLEADINKGAIPDALVERWPDFIWRSEVAYALNADTGESREVGVGIERAYPDLGAGWIYGTADIVGIGPCDEVVVVDRKGFDPSVPRAHRNPQLHMLALAVCRLRGAAAASVAIWHEVRPLDVHVLDVLDLDAFQAELAAINRSVLSARDRMRAGLLSPTPGQHCRYCPAFHSCPAQRALTEQVANDSLAARIEMTMPFRDDGEASQAYEIYKRLGLLYKRLGSALHARANEKPIPIGNGSRIGPVMTGGNVEVDGGVVYEGRREKHGQAVADAAVERSTSKKRIKEALGKVAGKGQLAAMERSALADVKDRGGISNKMTVKVCEYRPLLKAGNE